MDSHPSLPFDAPAVAGMTQLTDYDEIIEVLRSPDFLQSAYGIAVKDLMRDTLAVIDGDRHLRRRNILNQLFNDAAVAGYREQYLLPVIDQTLAEVAKAPRQQDGILRTDLVTLIQRCLYRVGGAIAGVDGLESTEAADKFIGQIKGLIEGFSVSWSREDPDMVVQKGLDAREAFRRDFFIPSYERRKALVTAARASGVDVSTLPRDVMTIVLWYGDDGWDGDDQVILREVSLFLTGSTQTTAGGFVSMFLHLENWFKAHPEDRVALAEDKEFLPRAAYEALRMIVASPARIRTATDDVTLTSGRTIKKGEQVALWFIPANASPDRFGPNADTFNPRRDVKNASPWGLAFGSGVHSCPGRPLVTGTKSLKGNIEAEGTMVSITRRFYEAGLELDPDHPPIRDTRTHYDLYTSVPIRFTKL